MLTFTFLCQTSIEEWTKTPWKEINVEQMDMELRRFAKVWQACMGKHYLFLQGWRTRVKFSHNDELWCTLKEMKMLDKEVRVWNVYMGLESTVKNLLTSLRAVNELQNPAVRERHWQQLMNTTRVWDYVAILNLVLFFFSLVFMYSAFIQLSCRLMPRPVMTTTVQWTQLSWSEIWSLMFAVYCFWSSGQVRDGGRHHPRRPFGITASPCGGWGQKHSGQGRERNGHRESKNYRPVIVYCGYLVYSI